jgi:hypothetical protein
MNVLLDIVVRLAPLLACGPDACVEASKAACARELVDRYEQVRGWESAEGLRLSAIAHWLLEDHDFCVSIGLVRCRSGDDKTEADDDR